jgi:hypothetical protein
VGDLPDLRPVTGNRRHRRHVVGHQFRWRVDEPVWDRRLSGHRRHWQLDAQGRIHAAVVGLEQLLDAFGCIGIVSGAVPPFGVKVSEVAWIRENVSVKFAP